MHSAALPPRQCLQNGPKRPDVLAAGTAAIDAAGATTVDVARTTADIAGPATDAVFGNVSGTSADAGKDGCCFHDVLLLWVVSSYHSVCKRTTRNLLHRLEFGRTGGIRTHISLLKRQVHQPFCHSPVVCFIGMLVGAVGFEPTVALSRVGLKVRCLQPLGNTPRMVPRVGFEPTTNGLKVRCSTIELPREVLSRFLIFFTATPR